MSINMSISNIIDTLVPISRFNKGEANKIFDEVKESGCKIVLKNNVPTCVLITPEKYQEMLELIENQHLLALANERINAGSATYSHEQIMNELGITQEEVDGTEVDFD